MDAQPQGALDARIHNGIEYMTRAGIARRLGVNERLFNDAVQTMGITPVLLPGDMRLRWYPTTDIERIRQFIQTTRGVILPG